MKKSFKILLFCALIGSLLLNVACHKEEEIYVEYERTDGKEKEYTFEDEIEENDCILKGLPGHNDIEGYHVIQGVTEEEFHKILEEYDLGAISNGIVERGNAYIAYTIEDVYTNENVLVYFYNEENPLLDRESVLKKYHYEEGHENIEEKIQNAENVEDIFNCIDNERCILDDLPGHDYGDFHLIEMPEKEWLDYVGNLQGTLVFNGFDEVPLDNGLNGMRGFIYLNEYSGKNPVIEKVILCYTDNNENNVIEDNDDQYTNEENETKINEQIEDKPNINEENDNNDEYTDEEDMMKEDSIEFEEDY